MRVVRMVPVVRRAVHPSESGMFSIPSTSSAVVASPTLSRVSLVDRALRTRKNSFRFSLHTRNGDPRLSPSKASNMNTTKREYLSETNHYQKQLIRLAEKGLPFIVQCTEEGCEPEYEGFAEEDAAQDCSAERESDTGCSHEVIKIEVDEDGCFWSTYEAL